MATPHVVGLLMEARRLLMISQGTLGERVGVSRRTAQRWETGGAGPFPGELGKIAKLVYPVSPEIAAELAAAGKTTLEALGLVVPPPPPPPPPAAPPPPPPPDAEHVIDSVVCAAAEAMDVMPRAVRPALLAAFRRARALGLSVEAMEKALAGDAPTRAKPARS